ncbi:hypothetical protein D9M71_183870 [compost metagenome]
MNASALPLTTSITASGSLSKPWYWALLSCFLATNSPVVPIFEVMRYLASFRSL